MITARTTARVGMIIPIVDVYSMCFSSKATTAEFKITFAQSDRMGVTICNTFGTAHKSNVRLDVFNTLLQINSHKGNMPIRLSSTPLSYAYQQFLSYIYIDMSTECQNKFRGKL